MIGFVRDVFRVLSMPCREHTPLLSKQLDEPLPHGIAVGLRIHVLYFRGCKRFRAQIRRLRDIAGVLGQELEAGEAMPGEVRERLRRRAAEASKINS